MSTFSSYHVGVAAEAIAAALFARCGYDVSVQYGANQPEYDLLIARGEQLLKVSVKGSKDGSWGLTQSLLRNRKYHEAIDRWVERFTPRTVLCFVQFKGKAVNEMPDAFLATPTEVAARLKQTAKGRGGTILYQHKKWTDRAVGAGSVDAIPDCWRFSANRIEQLFQSA